MDSEPLGNGADGRHVGSVGENPAFSWLDPHPIFVIVLVGSDEQPFGIQKDYLCSRSAFYRRYFAENDRQQSLEHIVRLADTAPEVFAFAQNYLFTGQVFPRLDNLPSYEILIGVWKLGYKLGIEGLCDATLEAMVECRRLTQHIPATPLLVQVWTDTPEGSSIRKLLLSWATEYMRSSESRAEFAKSLPQEVLSELVVAMSSLDSSAKLSPTMPNQLQRVHYLGPENREEVREPPAKKQRHSDGLPNGSSSLNTKSSVGRKPGPRTSLPTNKPGGKRRSAVSFAADKQFSNAKKLNFCSDLLTRMLSGPGFWTRLVGPFKEPVDPGQDGVPDYFEKVTKPMDLGTMKDKMDRNQYTEHEEFLADMNQIFSNCYSYWSKKDPMWGACEKLQKTFEEKYSQMHKWIAKMEGDEGS